ncbi:MAG: TniQ family protein [Nitrospirota bacterium]|nr:TniQ family protein [Nitrospirota bacterium]
MTLEHVHAKSMEQCPIGTDAVIPELLPGELLHGWRGRVRVLNLLESSGDAEALVRHLASEAGTAPDSKCGLLEYSAATLGKSVEELCERHLLVPFFKALTNTRRNKAKSGAKGPRDCYIRWAPTRIVGDRTNLCPKCVREDQEHLGFSYWRRVHQLPGVCWCPEHEVPLRTIPGLNSFDVCPDRVLDQASEISWANDTESGSGIMRRYTAIASEVLNRGLRFDSLTASSVLGLRAGAMNLRLKGNGDRPTVSTLAMTSLPAQWLNETFPRVRWSTGKFIATVDGACMSGENRYTPATLCLLAALLYEEAGIAIRELTTLPPEPCTTTARRQRGFDFWSGQGVFAEFVKQRGVIEKVADALGMHPSDVSRGLHSQGLPEFGVGTRSQSALRAFLGGASMDDACREADAATDQLESLLRAGCARLARALDAIENMHGRSAHRKWQ